MNVGEPNDFWGVFSALAGRVGDVEAILAPGRPSLRFAELRGRLEDIRATLAGVGIGRGDRVVVSLPRGPEMAVCYLGIAACATVVPMNPASTEDELLDALRRLRPKAVVVRRDDRRVIRSVVARLGVATLDLIPVEGAPAGTFDLEGAGPADRLEPEWATAEDTALILLTSGSTSRPKLVPLKHRHILAYAQALQAQYALGPADRCLHVNPMFHGSGLMSSLTLPLAAGCGVICAPAVDAASLFAQMHACRPTWYTAGYTFQRAILDHIHGDRTIVRGLNLRFISSGSGPLDAKVLRGLEEAFAAPVSERYSMSETGNLTFNPLPPRPRKPGTVGVPLLNDVRIVDGSGGFLGPHQEGEVVARGPSVFDGYWEDAEATARVFVDGWFRTGDLGRFDDDGYLTITGRLKELINRGGEKIGILEVEQALAAHPAVGRVCVFGIPHPTLGEEVAATAIPATGMPVSEAELLAFARKRLVPVKVPRRIFFATEFPTGATGKVDRSALARLCAAALVPGVPVLDAARGATSSLEVEVAALWQTVLKTSAIGIDEDFFLSGGDSLKAAQLVARVRERFGVALALLDVFDDGATVAGMARLIERARPANEHAARIAGGLIPLKTAGDRSPLFAMPGIEGESASFLHLARRLASRHPMYGLQTRGLDGACAPLDRIEDIAADNVARIRTFQPQGPYYLIGMCVGGLVAYEMARQLDAIGERVARLILLGPPAPFTDRHGRPRGAWSAPARYREWTRLPRFVLSRIAMHACALRGLKGEERAAYLREKLGVLCGIVGQRDLFRGDRTELHRMAVVEANSAAGRRYVPAPYYGPTVMFLTTGPALAGPRDHRLEWLGLAPQAGSPEYVAGDNSGAMLAMPHVLVLAERVNAWLALASAETQQ
jgi:oxalate---CoA ligase